MQSLRERTLEMRKRKDVPTSETIDLKLPRAKMRIEVSFETVQGGI